MGSFCACFKPTTGGWVGILGRRFGGLLFRCLLFARIFYTVTRRRPACLRRNSSPLLNHSPDQGWYEPARRIWHPVSIAVYQGCQISRGARTLLRSVLARPCDNRLFTHCNSWSVIFGSDSCEGDLDRSISSNTCPYLAERLVSMDVVVRGLLIALITDIIPARGYFSRNSFLKQLRLL